jgi:hypothetical protein
MMKRKKLFIVHRSDGDYDLVFAFNDKEIAIIPVGNDEDAVAAAYYLVNAFNKAQPED